ncbi:MAG: response regulator [Phycicoccus sp.]
MIRVVVVEDEPLLRDGLVALAERDGDIRVVGQAGDGAVAVARVRELHPHVVLMDLRMPDVDGIAATRLIREDSALAAVSVLVLTTFAEDESVLEALRAGAAGYLLKDVGAHELREAIRAVAAGAPVLGPDAATAVIRAATAATNRRDSAVLDRLAPREVEVLAEVGQGFSNAEIAERLHLSPATARTYVSRLLHKLDARDRAQLVVIAHRSGLVDHR